MKFVTASLILSLAAAADVVKRPDISGGVVQPEKPTTTTTTTTTTTSTSTSSTTTTKPAYNPTSFEQPAPRPTMDMINYSPTQLTLPSSFQSNISWVGFSLVFADFTEPIWRWALFNSDAYYYYNDYRPTGYVMMGRMMFTQPANPDDYLLGLKREDDDWGTIVYLQGDQVKFTNDDLANLDGFPSFEMSPQKVVTLGKFEDGSGGLGDEWGQSLSENLKLWDTWNYDYRGSDGWTDTYYDALVGAKVDDAYLFFTENIPIQAGATTMLAGAASLVATVALF